MKRLFFARYPIDKFADDEYYLQRRRNYLQSAARIGGACSKSVFKFGHDAMVRSATEHSLRVLISCEEIQHLLRRLMIGSFMCIFL